MNGGVPTAKLAPPDIRVSPEIRALVEHAKAKGKGKDDITEMLARVKAKGKGKAKLIEIMTLLKAKGKGKAEAMDFLSAAMAKGKGNSEMFDYLAVFAPVSGGVAGTAPSVTTNAAAEPYSQEKQSTLKLASTATFVDERARSGHLSGGDSGGIRINLLSTPLSGCGQASLSSAPSGDMCSDSMCGGSMGAGSMGLGSGAVDPMAWMLTEGPSEHRGKGGEISPTSSQVRIDAAGLATQMCQEDAAGKAMHESIDVATVVAHGRGTADMKMSPPVVNVRSNGTVDEGAQTTPTAVSPASLMSAAAIEGSSNDSSVFPQVDAAARHGEVNTPSLTPDGGPEDRNGVMCEARTAPNPTPGLLGTAAAVMRNAHSEGVVAMMKASNLNGLPVPMNQMALTAMVPMGVSVTAPVHGSLRPCASGQEDQNSPDAAPQKEKTVPISNSALLALADRRDEAVDGEMNISAATKDLGVMSNAVAVVTGSGTEAMPGISLVPVVPAMPGMPPMPSMLPLPGMPPLPPGIPPMPAMPPMVMNPMAMIAQIAQTGCFPTAAPGGIVPLNQEQVKVQLEAVTRAMAAAGGSDNPKESGEGDIMAAMDVAQKAQYQQQYQFFQQLHMLEAQQGRKLELQMPSRFKDDYRPTRLCRYQMKLGFCRQGVDCNFGHHYGELHPASPDMPEELTKIMNETTALAEQTEEPESEIPDMRLKKKKEMCDRFKRNECFLGKVCPFAHRESELGTVGLSVCGRVKLKLCMFWDAKTQTSKGCLFGKNCKNAHGEKEIGMKAPPLELCPPPKRRRPQEDIDQAEARARQQKDDDGQ
jgi:hypothetical protein